MTTTTYAAPPTEELNTRIVDAVAAALDEDPLALHPPLYHAIDTDALETLTDSDRLVRVEFEYADHVVVVESDGSVTVDAATEGENA